MVGLTSVGSGVFFGLSLLVLFPLRSSKVVGTDIFHAAALLWVAGAGHLVAGNVDLGSVAWLLVGSLPGVLIGSHVSVRLPDRVLQLALAITLAASGAKLLDLPSFERDRDRHPGNRRGRSWRCSPARNALPQRSPAELAALSASRRHPSSEVTTVHFSSLVT